MRHTTFTIDTDLLDDQGFEEAELIEKKLRHFIETLGGCNTKVKWNGFNDANKGVSKPKSSGGVVNIPLNNFINSGNTENHTLLTSESILDNDLTPTLQSFDDKLVNIANDFDLRLSVHRNQIKKLIKELTTIKTELSNHLALGNPLHNDY